MGDALTDDRLVGGRVLLRQPVDGLRATIDPVLLAAAVPAASGDRVLDMGCGSGAAALCLATRVDGATGVGLDIDPAMVRLAGDNARANGFADRLSFFVGDVARLPMRIAPATFDHVFANPPYLRGDTHRPPPDPARARATMESDTGLGAWIDGCLAMIRRGGSMTLIHRADRLGDVLSALADRTGGVVVFPLWPGGGKPAKRVIVTARKGSAAPPTLLPGLVLHQSAGGYTEQAEAVLRHGAGLEL